MSTHGTLYFLIGKMGAGKSTYSSKFAAETGAILLSEDEWLGKLYPGEINDFDDYIVRHRKLREVLGPHLQHVLRTGASVVLDFAANTRNSRQWFLKIAESAGVDHEAIYLDVPNETCLKQVEKRKEEQPERAQFDTPEMFELVTQYFEEPGLDEGINLRVIASQVG